MCGMARSPVEGSQPGKGRGLGELLRIEGDQKKKHGQKKGLNTIGRKGILREKLPLVGGGNFEAAG